jgi:hypothetical protein
MHHYYNDGVQISNGNVAYVLNNLEAAVDQICNNTGNIILCGDFSINYLDDNQNKQLQSL